MLGLPCMSGDSVGTSNLVRGWAEGQCGFFVLQPDPAPTKTTPAGPLTPISVRAYRHHCHDHNHGPLAKAVC
jgi:hypothetical protein